jgi:hypothetical protein
MAKMHFWQKLQNKTFAKKHLFDLKTLFLKRNLKQALNYFLTIQIKQNMINRTGQ